MLFELQVERLYKVASIVTLRFYYMNIHWLLRWFRSKKEGDKKKWFRSKKDCNNMIRWEPIHFYVIHFIFHKNDSRVILFYGIISKWLVYIMIVILYHYTIMIVILYHYNNNVRETASLGIMGETRVPPLNPSESIVLSKHYRLWGV